MSPYSLFFFCFYFLSIGDSFRFFRQNFIISKCSHFRMVQTFDSYADITADKDGGILKRIIRRGDYREGTPKDLDIAFISWKFFFLNGSLFHESTTGSRYRFLIPNTINFSDFSIMSPGITIGVKTMNKGETASFILTPKYGLGIRGSPPKTPRNLTFRADVTLLDFEPSNILPYESDSEDSSDCRDEIIENMYTRKLSKRPNGMTAQQYMEMDSSHNQSTISMEEQSHSESHQNNSTFPQALISTNEVTPSREGVEMFDPNKHQLLPSRRIHGKGHGFSWDETPEVIDVEIPLESYQSNVDGQLKLICKTDLDIRIKYVIFKIIYSNRYSSY